MQQMALIYQCCIFRGVLSAEDEGLFSIASFSSLTKANPKFCHWCYMGFFRKSPLHIDSCPNKSVAVQAVKRKRQETEVEVYRAQKRLRLASYEAAVRVLRRMGKHP